MTILSKAIYRINCNPYQTANGIFHRTRTKKIYNLYGNIKDPEYQSNLEKEEQSLRNQPSSLQTIYSCQDSMILTQRQKYVSMEKDRKPGNKSTHLSLTKEAKYTMKKRPSLQ